MSELLLDATPQPIAFGTAGSGSVGEIEQNIRLIVSTLAFAVRNDCRFANLGGYLDAPAPFEAARRVARLTEAIEEYEPRVQVVQITFQQGQAFADAAMDGRLFPVVRYTLRGEG